MKKMLRIALLILLTACGGEVTDPGTTPGSPAKTGGTLTVRNNSGTGLLLIHWTHYSEGNTFFCTAALWSTLLEREVSGMADGESTTESVAAGSSPLYFYFPIGGGKYETVAVVTVTAGSASSFTFTGETLIREASKSRIPGKVFPLNELYK